MIGASRRFFLCFTRTTWRVPYAFSSPVIKQGQRSLKGGVLLSREFLQAVVAHLFFPLRPASLGAPRFYAGQRLVKFLPVPPF